MVRSHSLLSLDLNADVHADGSRYGGLVCALVFVKRERKTGQDLIQILISSLSLTHTQTHTHAYFLLTQVVPDVHLSAERSDLDDGLSQEVVRLSFETLLHTGLNIIVLIPHSHFYTI